MNKAPIVRNSLIITLLIVKTLLPSPSRTVEMSMILVLLSIYIVLFYNIRSLKIIVKKGYSIKMNLFIIISIFIVCIIIIYVHVIKRGLHAQEKNKMYAFINQLSIPKMSEYKIVILRYDNYYFKSIDKLFETIEERHIVILTAPIWIYKRKTKCWPNQIVINSIDLEMNPNFLVNMSSFA